MKKIIVLIILTTVLAASIFAQNGVIREITGEVELKHAGTSAFVAASAGDTVNLNTIISTGFRSTAVVTVGSSTITVRPLTRLSLAEIQSSETAENVNVNLQAGRVRVEVKPAAGTRSNFTVQSPSATASVRGTSFDFDTVNVNVHEGRVMFGGSVGPSTIVNGGFFTFVGAEGAAENPIEVTSATVMPQAPVEAPVVTGQTAAPAGELSVSIMY